MKLTKTSLLSNIDKLRLFTCFNIVFLRIVSPPVTFEQVHY